MKQKDKESKILKAISRLNTIMLCLRAESADENTVRLLIECEDLKDLLKSKRKIRLVKYNKL